MSASPESLSRMRRKAVRDSLPDLEAREAADDHVLAGLGRHRGAHVLDGLAGVLVLVDVLLVEQRDLLEPLAQPALGDLRPDVLGLVGGLLLVDPELGLLDLVGDLVLGDVLRAGGRDLHGHLARELLEVVVAGHEVGLAVDLDEHADLLRRVHVRGDDALGGLALTALGGLGLALDAQDLDGLVHVAVGFLEGLLAVHHPRAGAVAEGLDVLGADLRHHALPSSLGVSPPCSGPGPSPSAAPSSALWATGSAGVSSAGGASSAGASSLGAGSAGAAGSAAASAAGATPPSAGASAAASAAAVWSTSWSGVFAWSWSRSSTSARASASSAPRGRLTSSCGAFLSRSACSTCSRATGSSGALPSSCCACSRACLPPGCSSCCGVSTARSASGCCAGAGPLGRSWRRGRAGRRPSRCCCGCVCAWPGCGATLACVGSPCSACCWAASASRAAASSASWRARSSSSRRRFSSASRRCCSSRSRWAASSSARNCVARSATTSPIASMITLHERIASSLPGIG